MIGRLLARFDGGFRNDEGGAVTVDWVVLTAGLTALGLITVLSVRGGMDILAGKIGISVAEQSPDPAPPLQ